MKTFKLFEERGEKAYKQAIAMGLKYGGFGYWKDPQTNETVYKTENDTLVPVEKDEESELAAKGSPDKSAGRPDPMAGGMAGGGGMTGVPGMLRMPGGGMGLAGQGITGAPEPGQEQAPKDRSWEPGPDGDTCVGPEALPSGEIPKDSFVGRTNFLKWRAGPDGDNMNTVTLGRIREQILESEDETKKSIDAKGMMRQALGADPKQSNLRGVGSRTMDDAKAAAQRLRDNAPTALGNQIAAMRKIANRSADNSYDSAPSDTTGKQRVEDGKKIDMHKKLVRLPAVARDAEMVKQMNQAARPLVSDPDYEMDQFHEDMDGPDFLGGGAFGSAYEDNNGNVVKTGAIGPSELAALYAMRDDSHFPTLINASFDEPFRHQSATVNNPLNADDEHRDSRDEMGQTNLDYWDPDDKSDFDDRFPTAQGRFAMTKSKGQELASIWPDLDEETRDKVLRSFWRARGALHKKGFSHNDMHGGNIQVDPDTGEVQILDLGLAKENRLSALMEALGGLDYEQGEDSQLAGQVKGASFTDRMQEMSDRNRGEVEDKIFERLAAGDQYSDGVEEGSGEYASKYDAIQSLLRGGIRLRGADFTDIIDDLPMLQDDEFVGQLIDTLYNEIGNSELADRMSDAFERRQKDSKVIRAADRIRKSRGEKPIEVTNPNVIPPRNMDFDD